MEKQVVTWVLCDKEDRRPLYRLKYEYERPVNLDTETMNDAELTQFILHLEEIKREFFEQCFLLGVER